MSKYDRIPNEVALAAQAGSRAHLGRMVPRLQEKAKHEARRMCDIHVDPEDYAQEALAAIIEALPDWDPGRASFETYADLVMRSAVRKTTSGYLVGASVPASTANAYRAAINGTDTLDEAQEAVKHLFTPATFQALYTLFSCTQPAHLVAGVGYEGAVKGEDGGEDAFYYGPARMVDHEEAHAERLDLLESVLQNLDERERFIVFMAYGHEDTDREIADALGIDRSRVNRIRNRALRKLREAATSEKDPS